MNLNDNFFFELHKLFLKVEIGGKQILHKWLGTGDNGRNSHFNLRWIDKNKKWDLQYHAIAKSIFVIYASR